MSSNGQVLAGMMGQAYLEVIPTKTIVDRLVHLPQHSYDLMQKQKMMDDSRSKVLLVVINPWHLTRAKTTTTTQSVNRTSFVSKTPPTQRLTL